MFRGHFQGHFQQQFQNSLAAVQQHRAFAAALTAPLCLIPINHLLAYESQSASPPTYSRAHLSTSRQYHRSSLAAPCSLGFGVLAPLTYHTALPTKCNSFSAALIPCKQIPEPLFCPTPFCFPSLSNSHSALL